MAKGSADTKFREHCSVLLEIHINILKVLPLETYLTVELYYLLDHKPLLGQISRVFSQDTNVWEMEVPSSSSVNSISQFNNSCTHKLDEIKICPVREAHDYQKATKKLGDNIYNYQVSSN